MAPGISTPGGEVSRYRVVLQDNKNKSFGTIVTENALIAALESVGSVWGCTQSREGTTCYVTFRQPEAVASLVAKGTLDVGGITVAVKPAYWHANTTVRRPPAEEAVPEEFEPAPECLPRARVTLAERSRGGEAAQPLFEAAAAAGTDEGERVARREQDGGTGRRL